MCHDNGFLDICFSLTTEIFQTFSFSLLSSTELLLAKCGVSYTYLNAETPSEERLRNSEPYWWRPKGIVQRNVGLQWIRRTLIAGKDHGVLYIADDDNTYDVQLFEEVSFKFSLT